MKNTNLKYKHKIPFLGILVGIFLWPYISLATPNDAILLTISGAIGPATADYIHRGMEWAKQEQAGAIIIQMDTPGGLDKSMRQIIQDILASPIPVITYVYPSGSRAASAGTYILYASHVSAMAPGTNLGAATPISIGMPDKPNATPMPSSNPKSDSKQPSKKAEKSSMEKKMINDATAYIRSLAEYHGRNTKWAQEAVEKAKSLSAEASLKKGVIDLMATDPKDLLQKAHGQTINLQSQKQTLNTKGLNIISIQPDWRNKILSVITSPDIAYILLLIGIYGLFFEFSNPGLVIPGIAGGISILLAMYALQMLPISYAGLGLIILGISLLIVEVLMPSFGILGIGGTIAFMIGSFLLFDSGSVEMNVSSSLIMVVTLLNAAFFLIIVRLVWQAHQKKVTTGQEDLLNSIGQAMESFDDKGSIKIHGEIWQAKTEQPILKDQAVKVIKVNGLTLWVVPVLKQ